MFRKMAAVYIAIMIALSGLVLRLRHLSADPGLLSTAAQTQARLTLNAGQGRGQIYDRYFRKLVNCEEKWVCVVNPTPRAVKTMLEHIGPDDKEAFLKMSDSAKPFIYDCGKEVNGEDIISVKVFDRYGESQLAPQLIGYVDSDRTGVAGIEKAFDDWLRPVGPQVRIHYQVNALGNALSGIEPTIDDSGQDSAKGVWLTIDRNIQKIAEEAAEKYIEKGAVVIMEVNSGNVVACVSKPDFSPLKVAQSLGDGDSPMLNRAFCAYDLGSLFKLVTAAAALESGITEKYQYSCKGEITVGERHFACSNRSGHGRMDMTAAMKKSCNPYFINLGQCIGGQSIYDMAVKLGFGSRIYFADTLISSSGNLPEKSSLTGAATANFSFGQGELLATPVQVCAMVNAIASDGEYYAPMIINGRVDDNKKAAERNKSDGVRVMSTDTAQSIQQMMREVLEEDGTGNEARSDIVTAAGKTATAQTGMIKDGKRVEHSWFGGFFPYLLPKYSVVVFCEDTSDGRATAQPVFRYISEAMTENAENY